MKYLLIALVKSYQRFGSPLLGGECRYVPSCSHYALESLRRHGAMLGIRLTLARLRRCTGDFPRGRDPVPTPEAVASSLCGGLVDPDVQAVEERQSWSENHAHST